MKINELQKGNSNITLTGTITKKYPENIVNTKFGERKVCRAELTDDTGTITMSLWEKQIKEFNEGDHIQITDAYVTTWNEKPQLNLTKQSEITKIGKE